jgi:glucuronosyltransferase
MVEIYRKKLNDYSIPNSDEVFINASIVISCSHFSVGHPRPFLPDIIEVGGMHMQPAKPLPGDLLKFADSSAPHGFIYFSLGSAMKGSDMPEASRQIFIRVFSRLKQKVLWKWETEEMPDLPPNVKLSKWAPQQDILGHPNCKVFMTHGGLLSLTEAANQGVPVIVFPLFADQDYNANIVEKVGRGVKVEITEVTVQILKNALSKILSTDAYKARTTELSKVFNDRPEKPLQTAVWWTEYVLRHESTSHLKPGNLHQTWYERRLLDVWLFILTTVLLSLSVVIYIMVKCLRLILVPKKISKEKRSHKVKRN